MNPAIALMPLASMTLPPRRRRACCDRDDLPVAHDDRSLFNDRAIANDDSRICDRQFLRHGRRACAQQTGRCHEHRGCKLEFLQDGYSVH
jgi:hypothetical protein